MRLCASLVVIVAVLSLGGHAVHAESDRPPVFQPMSPRVVPEGQRLEQTVMAVDPEGRRLQYDAKDLPQGATFTGQTLIWPSPSPAGTYQITFIVEDRGKEYRSEPWTIRVVRPAGVLAPVLSLIAIPPAVAPDEATTLSWSATGLKACRAAGGWGGNKAARGRETVHPSVTTDYTLVCSGEDWSLIKTVTIAVDPTKPMDLDIVISATPRRVAPGQLMTIRWSAPDFLVQRMDWIGLFEADAPGQYARWRHYLRGEPEGRTVAKAPDRSGDYELRYVYSGPEPEPLASFPVTVTEPEL